MYILRPVVSGCWQILWSRLVSDPIVTRCIQLRVMNSCVKLFCCILCRTVNLLLIVLVASKSPIVCLQTLSNHSLWLWNCKECLLVSKYLQTSQHLPCEVVGWQSACNQSNHKETSGATLSLQQISTSRIYLPISQGIHYFPQRH